MLELHVHRGQCVGDVAQRTLTTPLGSIDPVRHLAGPLGDVRALVAVLGKLGVVLARCQRRTEELHLNAPVVDVELALYAVPTPGEDPSEGVPEGAPPAVACVEWARRVGADVLDVGGNTGTDVEARVAVARLDDLGEDVVQPGGREAEVDEPGPCDLHRGHVGRWIRCDAIDDVLGEFARVTPGRLRAGQRHVGRPVTVVAVGRALEVDRRRARLDLQHVKRGRQRGDQRFSDHGHRSSGVRSCSAIDCTAAPAPPSS